MALKRKFAIIALATTLAGAFATAAEARSRNNWVGPAIAGAIVGGIIANQMRRPAYAQPRYYYQQPRQVCRDVTKPMIDPYTGQRVMARVRQCSVRY